METVLLPLEKIKSFHSSTRSFPPFLLNWTHVCWCGLLAVLSLKQSIILFLCCISLQTRFSSEIIKVLCVPVFLCANLKIHKSKIQQRPAMQTENMHIHDTNMENWHFCTLEETLPLIIYTMGNQPTCCMCPSTFFLQSNTPLPSSEYSW